MSIAPAAPWRHWLRALRRSRNSMVTLVIASTLIIILAAGLDLRRQVDDNMAFTLQRAELLLHRLERHQQSWQHNAFDSCDRSLQHRLLDAGFKAGLLSDFTYISQGTGFCRPTPTDNITAQDAEKLLATTDVNGMYFMTKTQLNNQLNLIGFSLADDHYLVVQAGQQALHDYLLPLQIYSGRLLYQGHQVVNLGPKSPQQPTISFHRQRGDFEIQLILPASAFFELMKLWALILGPIMTLLSILVPLLASQRNSLAGIHLNDIEQDLRKDRIRPVYQPVVHSDTGEIKGYEQLARWHSPDLGAVPPDRFITLLERHQRIGNLVEHLFRCGRPALADGQYLSINVNPGSLRSESIVKEWLGRARKERLKPRQIMLEITERDPDALQESKVIDHLHALKAAGFLIAFDDFGTGHSDLGLLGRFKPDIIKLDKEYVQADTAGLHRSMLIAIIDFCRRERIGLVAEGVETQGQRDWLRSQGVTQMQGYLFSRPMELASVARDRPQSALTQAQQILSGQFNFQPAAATGHE